MILFALCAERSATGAAAAGAARKRLRRRACGLDRAEGGQDRRRGISPVLTHHGARVVLFALVSVGHPCYSVAHAEQLFTGLQDRDDDERVLFINPGWRLDSQRGRGGVWRRTLKSNGRRTRSTLGGVA
jgi:hypothetical protein